MRQKLIRLLPIVAVITVLWIGYYYTKSKESFDNPSIDKTFFNNVNNLFNPAMPHRITTADMNKATQVRRATNQPYIGNAYEQQKNQENTKVGTIYDPQALEKAKICEMIKGEDCNAFDTADFAKYCGISFDANGTNSKGDKHVGGLYIDPTYKESVPKNGTFYPTFGTSDYFAINKRTCKYMKDDIACKKTHVVGTNNCTLCYTTGSFQAIEAGNTILKPGFTFFTNATDLEIKVNSTAYTLISSNSNIPVSANVIAGPAVTASTGQSMKTVSITNLNVTEGQSLIITAKHTNTDTTVLLAGYLQGLTQASTTPLQMDINNIMNTDNGGTPLVGGSVSGYLIIQQNYNKDNVNIKLNGIMPFSFVDTTSPDSDSCTNGPFITTKEGADYIAQNEPCYGPDAKKGGVYSKACLQSLFLGAGGTLEGKGYPKTDVAAAILNSQGTGSLSDIGYYLYRKSVLASTGTQDGNTVSMADWDAASQFMTGKSIGNPCETSDKKMSISTDCFNFLYNASGCIEKGTYNPNIAKNPTYVKPDPIKTTKNISDVRDFYATTKQTADNPAISNNDRKASFLGCYGVDLKQF
jgi:hypothetical protein